MPAVLAAWLAVAPAPARAQVSIYQCENGRAVPRDCTGAGTPYGWTTGSANSAHSLYREGDFVPFRVVIRYGLVAGHHYTLGIGYDAVKNGLHAYDYLGTYDASRRGDQRIVPCDAVAQTQGPHACGAAPSTLDVPEDAQTTFLNGGQQPGEFSAWGARLTAAAYVLQAPIAPDTGGTVQRSINLTFTADGPAAVIAWGGHVASVFNWGLGRTYASAGSGAAFHMRLKSTVDDAAPGSTGFNPGNQELSLHPDVIARPPTPFTTAVAPASVGVGLPVIDTAQLGGSPAPDGFVRFFVCGPSAGPPDCTFGGTPAGHDEVVTANGSAAVEFTPQAAGTYCFRAEFRPSSTAAFSPGKHTDLTAECFTATGPAATPGTLTVVKSCVPATDRGRFTITITGQGQTISQTLGCGGTVGPLTLPAGSYRVTERGADGTNLAKYVRTIGGDCTAGGHVQVADGESATCTINNERRPPAPRVAHLTVRKVCVPSNDAGRFTLRVGDISAPDERCGGALGPLALPPGTHRVSEAAGTGTDLTAYTTVIGGACAADGSIRLRARQSATCTITNVRTGVPTAVLTVVKHCDPAGDDGRFTLTVDEQEFPGLRCGQSTGPVTVATGVHLVGEVATSGVVEGYATRFGGDCAATGTITLAAGQQASCTVTNVRVGRPPAIRPASACYTLRASPRSLRAGRHGSVEVRAAVRGTPVGGVLVRLAGAGIAHSGRTGAAGVARFGLRPPAAGTIAVTTPRQFGCPAVPPRRIAVRGLGPAVTG